jgi:hypothetical protein
MIGTLGPVVFETSTERIRTFDDFKRSGSGRWATHEIMRRKPAREFLGPGAEQISLSMRLDASLGISPANELYILRFLRDNGVAVPFILNGEPVSENYWVIESISENWRTVDNRGRLLVAQVEVSLSEYVTPLSAEVL